MHINDKDFKVDTVDQGQQVDLRHHGTIQEMRPIECHIKPDGDINDNPALIFVLSDMRQKKVVAQISLKMFMPVIRELRKMGHLQ